MLLGPVERQVELGQSRCGEHDGLSALQDHANELWAQEGEVNKARDVAPGDAVALGQILQRSGAAGGQLPLFRSVWLFVRSSPPDQWLAKAE